jgi:hypothetical protein
LGYYCVDHILGSKLLNYHTKTFFLAFAVFVAFSVAAQTKEGIFWCLEGGIIIDFNSRPPKVSRSTRDFWSGCGSSISDDLGNLLFYTSSDSIWNANHDMMTGGVGINRVQTPLKHVP